MSQILPAGPRVPARVRDERRGDEPGVRRVNESAFDGAIEADVVDAVRRAGAVTLSLVAEDAAGRLVGHALFTPARIESAAGITEAIALGPMAVLPELQNQGVGTRLARAGLDQLRAGGHAAVVVLGHPDYYPRFGFVRASRFGLAWEHSCPDEAFMALELRPGALAAGGVVRYRPEFGAP